MAQLDEFLRDPESLSVWSVVGPSGSGKTRLAREWLSRLSQNAEWECGFTAPLLAKEIRNWRPTRHTAVVIDDLFESRSTLKLFLERCLELRSLDILRFNVRILLLDRQFPERIPELVGNLVWGGIFRRSYDVARMGPLLYQDQPLLLQDKAQTDEFITSIVCAAASIPNRNDERVVEVLKQIREMPGANRPLFAALLARRAIASDEKQLNDIRSLSHHHLTGADRIPWLSEIDDGQWIGGLLAASIFLGGLSKEQALSFLPSEITDDATRLNLIFSLARQISGQMIEDAIPPIIPDFFGDLFFLSYLEQIKSTKKYYLDFVEFLQRNEASSTTELRISRSIRIAESLLPDSKEETAALRDWTNLLDLVVDMKGSSTSTYRYGLTFFELFAMAIDSGNTAYIDAFFHHVGIVRIEKFPSEDFEPRDYILPILQYINDCFSYSGFEQEEIEYLVGSLDFFYGHYDCAPSPLYICAWNNLGYVAEKILDAGAIVDAVEKDDELTALHVAAHEGHLDFVRLLLSSGANPNAMQEPDGTTPLILAAQNGHSEVCEELYSAGASIYYECSGELPTPLHAAAYGGSQEIVKWLLSNEINPDVSSEEDSHSPLALACFENHLSIVKLLIAEGASLDLIAEGGMPLLTLCVLRSNFDIVETLLQAGASVNYPQGEGLYQPLDAAATRGKTDVVQLLLEHNAEVNIIRETEEPEAKYTPLAAALRTGTIESADLILRFGADPNFGHRDGYPTALEASVSHGNVQFVDQLIECGADVNATSVFGITALISAATWSTPEVVGRLLEAGANPNSKRDGLQSALMVAAKRGSVEICFLLLDAGADISHEIEYVSGLDVSVPGTSLHYAAQGGAINTYDFLQNKDPDLLKVSVADEHPMITAARAGQFEFVEHCISNGTDPNLVSRRTSENALIWAAINGHHETCSKLLERGADPNKGSLEKNTALMWACQANHSKVVEVLLSHKADTECQQPNGNRALHVAASHNSNECTLLLIDANADIDARGNGETTPLMCAAHAGHVSTIELLHKHGADLSAKTEAGLSATDIAHFNFSRVAATRLVELGAPPLSIRARVFHLVGVLIGGLFSLINRRKLVNAIGEKLLHHAEYGYVDQVTQLLEFIDVNYQNEEGISALHEAAANNYEALAELLVKEGADPEIQSVSGVSPIDVARHYEFDSLLESLVQAANRNRRNGAGQS